MCSTNYEFYKQHNICVKCGQEDAERNHTLCLTCMMKERERALNYYYKHKEERKNKLNAKRKDRYNKLKELGICTRCGKRKTKNKKTTCEYCRIKEDIKRRKRYLLNVYATKNMSEIRI